MPTMSDVLDTPSSEAAPGTHAVVACSVAKDLMLSEMYLKAELHWSAGDAGILCWCVIPLQSKVATAEPLDIFRNCLTKCTDSKEQQMTEMKMTQCKIEDSHQRNCKECTQTTPQSYLPKFCPLEPSQQNGERRNGSRPPLHQKETVNRKKRGILRRQLMTLKAESWFHANVRTES